MKMKISNIPDEEIHGWIGCQLPPSGEDFPLRLISANNQFPNIVALLEVKECEALLNKLREYLEHEAKKKP